MTELKLAFFAGLAAAFLAAMLAVGIALVIISLPGSVAAVRPDSGEAEASSTLAVSANTNVTESASVETAAEARDGIFDGLV